MLITVLGERVVALRQPCQNVKNSNVPQLEMKKSLLITAFYFTNSINAIPVPGAGWGLTAGAATVIERTERICGETGWVQACVF